MWDREAKERLGYIDPRTRVYFDGRERLYGKDWFLRKQEVWLRGYGHCEKDISSAEMRIADKAAIRCRSEMHDPHHIITRGKKRDDRLNNLIGLCRLHHDLAHDKRNPRWSKKEVAA
jgi:hypothetical protein